MVGGGRRKTKKHLLRKFYCFSCNKASSFDDEDYAQIANPGFSRAVFVNDPDRQEAPNLNSNYVATTKYTMITFLPKALFEQFKRVANIYFLLTGLFSFTSLAPYSADSAIFPLIVVISATMAKEAIEDWRRYQQDAEVNNREVKAHIRDGVFHKGRWKNLRIGDVVKVEKDDFFPCDLIFLSSQDDDGICYVETTNLDGETNLKMKQAIEETSRMQDDSSFADFRAAITCEEPNPNLYAFVGSLEYQNRNYPLSPLNLLLRDSKLRNTEFIYGAVVFTGHDTKVVQNSTSPPSKRSGIERKLDKIIYLLLSGLVAISALGSIFFGIAESGGSKRWYLRPDESSVFFDPKRAGISAVLHFLTALILYGYFIPISLYVSIEVVKVLQTIFINNDIEMYHEETDKPARCRTSNLTEELGQVCTLLSDKTGTLTMNQMEFVNCSIAGIAYGRRTTARRSESSSPRSKLMINSEEGRREGSVKWFDFSDNRVMEGNWIREPRPDLIQMFFRALALCHIVITEAEEKDEAGRGTKVSYKAESPDEAALVVAAREVGFEFAGRTQTHIHVSECLPHSDTKFFKSSYKLMNILEFTSDRKRMSVIVRTEDGRLLLLSKGADSVIFERLDKESGNEFEEKTKEHVKQYSEAGLRTLVVAYRELKEEDYQAFSNKFMAAKNSVSADREDKIHEAAEMVEKDLILLGATAVEDKLQPGVSESIEKLQQAGIRVWVLTGDKMETAINIGFSCSLLTQSMKQVVITLDFPEMIRLEKEGSKDDIAKASKESVLVQITEGKKLLDSSPTENFALIIDGRSLTFALEHDLKKMFVKLALGCKSVICCRSSPKQKALVTRLVKEGTKKVTLAIGDGANDVGMLQEADIGIGISGADGMQAVMSSDIAIAQFRFLERLLLIHGHWCYRRITSMICYFFYKNITFGVTLFIYEAYTSFSGQPAYNDWAMSLYNVFFTSLPAIALGVFDQDVSARLCRKFPLLYQEGVQNMLFSWTRILGWMFNGVCSGVSIFYLCSASLQHQSFRKGGEVADLSILGTTMYTCAVWTVNCQMAIFISYFTPIQHLFIWGSILVWYIFLASYGSLPPAISTTQYMVFIEDVMKAPSYWLVTLLVVVSSLIPYFLYKTIEIRFFPLYHGVIQWLRYENSTDCCQAMKQKPSRFNTVVVSEFLETKANQIKGKVHHLSVVHHTT